MPPFNQKKPHLNLSATECMRLEIEDLKQRIANKAAETQQLRNKWNESARVMSENIQNLTRKRKVRFFMNRIKEPEKKNMIRRRKK